MGFDLSDFERNLENQDKAIEQLEQDRESVERKECVLAQSIGKLQGDMSLLEALYKQEKEVNQEKAQVEKAVRQTQLQLESMQEQIFDMTEKAESEKEILKELEMCGEDVSEAQQIIEEREALLSKCQEQLQELAQRLGIVLGEINETGQKSNTSSGGDQYKAAEISEEENGFRVGGLKQTEEKTVSVYKRLDIDPFTMSRQDAMQALQDYYYSHSYSKMDYPTYSKDVEWLLLQRAINPDAKLPELTSAQAKQQLQEYMYSNNYGKEDFATYSTDMRWRALTAYAYPGTKLPIRHNSDNKGGWSDISCLMAASESIKIVNPNFNQGHEFKVNCQRCVPTYEMRRRGYNVTVLPNNGYDGDDYLTYHPFGVWEDPEIQNTSGNGYYDIVNSMKTWGDGARAQIVICYANGVEGHTFVAEQRNGKTYFYDPQNPDKNANDYFNMCLSGCTQFCRIDNLMPNNRILECCKEV